MCQNPLIRPSTDQLNHFAELLKVEDVETHVFAMFLRICAKFALFTAKQEKQAFKENDFGTI